MQGLRRYLRSLFLDPRVASAIRAPRTGAARVTDRDEHTELRFVGRVDPANALTTAPLTGQPCVFWYVLVQYQTPVMNRSTGEWSAMWEVSRRDASREAFFILDDSDGELTRVRVDLGPPAAADARDALKGSSLLVALPSEDVTMQARANPSMASLFEAGPIVSYGKGQRFDETRCYEARLVANASVELFGAVKRPASPGGAYRAGATDLSISGSAERPLVLLPPGGLRACTLGS